MGDVVDINPSKTEMLKILGAVALGVELNRVSGLILISLDENGYSLDMPGSYVGDINTVCQLLGKLKLVGDSLSNEVMMDYFGNPNE